VKKQKKTKKINNKKTYRLFQSSAATFSLPPRDLCVVSWNVPRGGGIQKWVRIGPI
jgi:hypothetical protein